MLVRGPMDTTCTEVSRRTWTRAKPIIPSLTAMVATSAAQPIMIPSTESIVRRGWMRIASTPTRRLASSVSIVGIAVPGTRSPVPRGGGAPRTGRVVCRWRREKGSAERLGHLEDILGPELPAHGVHAAASVGPHHQRAAAGAGAVGPLLGVDGDEQALVPVHVHLPERAGGR